MKEFMVIMTIMVFVAFVMLIYALLWVSMIVKMLSLIKRLGKFIGKI